MIDELTKREQAQRVAPDPDIDAFIKVRWTVLKSWTKLGFQRTKLGFQSELDCLGEILPPSSFDADDVARRGYAGGNVLITIWSLFM
jgi:hypothetical protein